jgi:hypothetical protein
LRLPGVHWQDIGRGTDMVQTVRLFGHLYASLSIVSACTGPPAANRLLPDSLFGHAEFSAASL